MHTLNLPTQDDIGRILVSNVAIAQILAFAFAPCGPMSHSTHLVLPEELALPN